MKPSAERLAYWLAEHRRTRDAAEDPRNALPALSALQRWQSERLALTYADLAAQSRFADATRFFLDDLYGEHDFSDRDRALEKVAPLLVRLLSDAVIATVSEAVELAALSHRLDLSMADFMQTELDRGLVVDLDLYGRAYRATGERSARERQIELIVHLGYALEGHVRKAWIRRLLWLARGPARAAGLGDLQGFLERGFQAFRRMGPARPFLDLIESRERDAMDRLFEGREVPWPQVPKTQPKASSR